MRISNLRKSSFIDYPGLLSAVVFTQGCNLRCCYCHNPHLIGKHVDGLITADEVLSFLQTRRQKLQGVVITGGEPSLQQGLVAFVQAVKELGFKVKLDTNGTKSDVIQTLLAQDLLDYVALDIKAPWQRYEQIVGTACDTKSIQRTLSLLEDGTVPYELRTTVADDVLSAEDIKDMCTSTKGKHYLQRCRPDNVLRPDIVQKKTELPLEQLAQEYSTKQKIICVR